MSAYALNPHLEASDQALPWLTLAVFPVWATAILIVSGFAATFSSGNSDAAAGAVFFIRHIFRFFSGRYPARPLRAARIMIALMMAAAIVLAAQFETVVEFVVFFVSLLGSGLAVVILLGRFWSRSTWQGALAALVAGAAVSLFVIWVPGQKELWGETIIPATLGALLAHLVVSLLTPQEKLSFEQVAELMAAERSELD
jgi:SSS family solute:Na+ symporter